MAFCSIPKKLEDKRTWSWKQLQSSPIPSPKFGLKCRYVPTAIWNVGESQKVASVKMHWDSVCCKGYVAEGVLPKTCKSRSGGLSYLIKELSEVLQLPHKLTSVNLFVSKSALATVMKKWKQRRGESRVTVAPCSHGK